MDPSLIGYLGVAVLLVLMLLGLHIGVALGLVGMLGAGLIVGWDGSFTLAVGSIYHQVSGYELLTVPLFIFMGYLTSVGGVSKDIYDSLSLWFNRIKRWFRHCNGSKLYRLWYDLWFIISYRYHIHQTQCCRK